MHLQSNILQSNPDLPEPLAFDPLSYQASRSELQLALPFLEYTDELLFHGIDMDEVYASPNVRCTCSGVSRHVSFFQLLAHLLNGARTSYAAS